MAADLQDMLSDYRRGVGLKAIAKRYGMPYSGVRDRLLRAGVTLRSSREVTDFLRQIRSENMTRRIRLVGPNKSKNSRLGIGGYYFNGSKRKWVWLRSAYEYIYACWLDRNGYEWDVEKQQLRIGGIWYRPDFFIYENGVLTRIVEIKSKWIETIQKGRSADVHEFDGVPVERILNIIPFIPVGSSYSSELRDWRKIAESNKTIKKIDAIKEKARAKQERMDRLREQRHCAVCGAPYQSLRTAVAKTCGNPTCYNKLKGERTTRERKERWQRQKEQIISIFKSSGITLKGRNRKPSLKPLYPLLEKSGISTHINILRGMFNVRSLYSVVKILEESTNVPR